MEDHRVEPYQPLGPAAHVPVLSSPDITRARPEDAARLTEIAHAAKRHWPYPEAWIDAWRDVLTFTPDYVRVHPVFAACEASAILGCYALVDKGPRCMLDHFWVHPDAMGHGVGRRLFAHAAAEARDLGAHVLEIDADPHAEGFYLTMGARRVGEVVTDVLGTRRVRPLLCFDLK